MRSALGPIVAAAVLAPVPAAAQERSIWALVVNEEPKGDIDLLLTPDGPWVDPAALLAAGLRSCRKAAASLRAGHHSRVSPSPHSRR